MRRAISAFVLAFASVAFIRADEAVNIRVDRLSDARHVGDRPVFSWQMRSERRGARQTAYRVEVDGAWDSGVVESPESLAVRYAGGALREASAYRWRVHVRNELGEWCASAWAQFSTGFFSIGFWDGSAWITPANTNETKTAAFRKVIVNRKPVAEAFWAVSGLGVFEARANGRRITGDVLKPGFTEAEACRHAFTYEITGLMARNVGETNELTALVTGGWWCDELRGRPVNPKDGSKSRFYPEHPGFRGQLVIRHVDGSETRIGTGEDWEASYSGPVIRAGIWEGERYDARRTTGEWHPAAISREFAGKLRNFVGPTVAHREDIAMSPVDAFVVRGAVGASEDRFGDAVVLRRWRQDAPLMLEAGETLVLDFGQNAAAVPEFSVDGCAGARLVVRHAEMLNEKGGSKKRGNDGPGGTPYFANLRGISACVDYTLADGRQTYRPLHTFFGYRYAAVTSSVPVTIERFVSVPVTSIHKEDETGRLTTSSELVNRLLENVRWSQLSNYLSVPTDCPQRNERLGWTGDTQAFAAAATRNADVYGFLRKWLGDLRDGQMTNGAYRCVAPDGRWPHFGAMAGWCDAGVIVPYVLWKRYGDTSAIEDGWDSMCRYMDHLERCGGHDRHNFGDWLALEHECAGRDTHNQPLEYKKCFASFYWVWDAMMMREMAEALGKADAAARYRDAEQRARRCYAELYRAADGTIKDDFKGQTTSLFLLKLGLLPDEAASVAVKRLLAEDIRAHGNTLRTGFLGTSILMETLSEDASMPDVAWTLLLQRNFPSWLYSVDQGATTIWERWNGYTKANGFGPVSMNSFNHYAYGSVIEWLYGFAAGIRPAAPGYRRILLKPCRDPRMRMVDATFDSPMGRIESAWRYEGDVWRWRFSIPANTSADVVIPGAGTRTYASGTYEIEMPAGRGIALRKPAALPSCVEPAKPWRMVNLDNDGYFIYAKNEDDITEKAFADYVDGIVSGGKVTHLIMCVCGQRASFDSKAWGAIWEGMDEPDQDGRTGNQWCRYAKLAHDRGIDPWKTWIDRCRANGVAAFLSMRMNDVHYVDQAVHFRHRRFWREHPEFRRRPDAISKKGAVWNDFALDYTHKEVQDDALAMLHEILQRWDADGIELDWMRFSQHLPPKIGPDDVEQLTSFMRKARALVVEAENTRGHRIAVAVRVPSTWESAHALGYDVDTWAKESLADIVIPCNTYTCSDFDMDMPAWRKKMAAANAEVAVVPGTDICVSCDWRVKSYYFSQLPFFYGWCSLYADNPDGLYFFNVPHLNELKPEVYRGDLSPAALAHTARRYPVTWHDNGIASANRNWRQLPCGFDATVKLHVYAATPGRACAEDVIVSFDSSSVPDNLGIALNGQKGERIVPVHGAYGRNAQVSVKASFAPGTVRDGENELVLLGEVLEPTKVVWAEIAFPGEVRHEEIALWPEGTMPCRKDNPRSESLTERSKDHVLLKRDVSVPTITHFPPSGNGAAKPAVVVCPGGGYGMLAWNKEGTEIADWLNTLGICAFVLKYRVPGNPDGAFCDAQRAISTIRARASEFAVDSKRVGMIGFSAGGNLAARTSADGRRFYSPVDGLDDSPCRPDFSLLIYPWALVPGKDSEKDLPLVLRPEFPVDGSTPMAFIVQSEDDCFHVENSLAYAAALKRAGVPFELHVYPDGVHGYGLRNRFAAVSAWSRLAEQWLRRNVLVP